MTYYYQFINLLLAAGHIYCLQEFALEDGNTFELSSTEKIEKDVVLNDTHIEKLFNYKVKGFTKTNDTRVDFYWSRDILSVSELQFENRDHNITNCNVYLNPPYLKNSEHIFKLLQKDIWNDICENSTTINSNNSMISESENIQSRDGLNTVIDAALLLARKNLKIDDFMYLPNMNFGNWCSIEDGIVGNLSTIARATSVLVSNNNDVLTLNFLLKMESESNFTWGYRFTARAPKTVAGATIKLDYSKEKWQIVVDDVELDFNDSLEIGSPDLQSKHGWFFNLLSSPGKTVNIESKIGMLKLFVNPVFLKPHMKTQLEKYLNKYVNF